MSDEKSLQASLQPRSARSSIPALKRTSIAIVAPFAVPTYNKMNPAPQDWPEAKKVHHLDLEALSRTESPQSNTEAAPTLPSLPQFHPLYPNPHLEPCTSGSLMHALGCGHIIITPDAPESCGKNCDANNLKPDHPEKSPPKSTTRTTEAFYCPACISALLEDKYARELERFLDEMVAIENTLGFPPRGLIDQRLAALQKVWKKDREADWLQLTSYGRRCQPIDTETEMCEDLEKIFLSELHSIEHPNPCCSEVKTGTSRDEGVRLTYHQLLRRPLNSSPRSEPKSEYGAPLPYTKDTSSTSSDSDNSFDIIKTKDLDWTNFGNRMEKVNNQITELAARTREAATGNRQSSTSVVDNVSKWMGLRKR
ncbi:MAG: hypothetical protein M1820_009505 [Bogoriella megaspora]|nr:MAG: hypothetical protein M1820_009505 [Bogoriella megaspora]